MRHTICAAAIVVLAGGPIACGTAPDDRPGVHSGDAAAGTQKEAEKHRYVVYFDLGQTAVTDEGRAVLETLGKEIGDPKSVDIQVAGYTDRLGSAAANMKLAERRIASVVAILREMGVEDAAIDTIARGEANPAVATPDGVPKAQNRRVEISVIRLR